MDEKESTLRGKGLIGNSDDSPVLLGSLAARSLMADVDASPGTTLRGKGLSIIDRTETTSTERDESPRYRSVKNGDFYVIAEGPVKEGLIRLRNTRNGSIITLSADVIDDPNRFVLAE